MKHTKRRLYIPSLLGTHTIPAGNKAGKQYVLATKELLLALFPGLYAQLLSLAVITNTYLLHEIITHPTGYV